MRVPFLRFIFIISFFLVNFSPHSSEARPAFFAIGNFSLGTLTVPSRINPAGVHDWSFLLDSDVSLLCLSGGFCKEYSVHVFDAKLRLGFNSKSYVSFVSYLQGNLDIFRFHIYERPTVTLQFSTVGLSVLRSPTILNVNADVTLSAAKLDIQFAKLNRSWAKGLCQVRTRAVGEKTVVYATNTVPFNGFFLAGIEPGCSLELKNRAVRFSLGLSVGTELSVGNSGSYVNPLSAQSGAILSESQANGFLELGVFLPNNIAGITEVFVRADAQYALLVNSGLNTLHMGDFLGIMGGFHFGEKR